MLRERIKKLKNELEKKHSTKKMIIAVEDKEGYEVNGKRYKTIDEVINEYGNRVVRVAKEVFERQLLILQEIDKKK
jgi:hypothetical protein